MKFTMFKALVASIFICSLVFSRVIRNKNENSEKSETQLWKATEGSGSWDTFYDCPRIFFAEGKGNYQNQGSAKIFAKSIVNASTNEEKLGLVFEFGKAPGALFKKVATLISGNKYYVPYRYFSGDISYGNPSMNNKYLEGSLTSDDKVNYRMKIDLPYKRIGYFLDDEEGRKMASSINSRTLNQKSTVKDLKSNITGQTSEFVEKKKQLDAAQKGEEELKKVLEAQEKEANELKDKMNAKKTEIENQKKAINEEKLKVAQAEAKLQKLQDSLTADTAKFNQITDTIQREKTSKATVEQKVKSFQNELNAVNTKLGQNFGNLRTTAPIRKPEIDNGEAAAKKSETKVVADNLNKIHA